MMPYILALKNKIQSNISVDSVPTDNITVIDIKCDDPNNLLFKFLYTINI